VVTSRPEFDVKTPLQALNPFTLDTQSESNLSDIRDYLRRELTTHLQNRPNANRLVEQILERSEGVFLYVERFCDDVQQGHLSLDRRTNSRKDSAESSANTFSASSPTGKSSAKMCAPRYAPSSPLASRYR